MKEKSPHGTYLLSCSPADPFFWDINQGFRRCVRTHLVAELAHKLLTSIVHGQPPEQHIIFDFHWTCQH